MNLIGKKVLLREVREGDMEIFNEMINSPTIEANVVGWSKPVTIYEQNEWYKNIQNDSSVIRYSVCEANEGVLCGTAIISRIDWKNRVCSIDIKLCENAQGKGYGTETIALLKEYIFNELNLNRIEVKILETNIGSQKLFQKSGFVREGVLRRAVYKKGNYINLFLYSYLKEEYLYEGNR